MFGHTFRMTDDTPAKRAMLHYFDEAISSYLGRPRRSLSTNTLNWRRSDRATSQASSTLHRNSRTLTTCAASRRSRTVATSGFNFVQYVTDKQVTEPFKSIKPWPRRNVIIRGKREIITTYSYFISEATYYYLEIL
jgi:hypothetical protein